MKFRASLVLLATLHLSSCGGTRERTPLVLASTTSTQDSGLLDALIPAFTRAHPEYDVKLVAVGTGEALQLGRRRDADVLLVHDPAAESTFVAEGNGTRRRQVMYNDFVIVGPESDPAGIAGSEDAGAALMRIRQRGERFVSRGDDSGTHRRELRLWRATGSSQVPPRWKGYIEAGQGMGEVLHMADERNAYTLSDRGTYLALRSGLRLRILGEGDGLLRNQYGVIEVTGARNPAGAAAFAEWITSPAAQRLIASFGVREFGQPLFVPDAQAGR